LQKNKNKIFEVCKGKRKHWAGYKWEYKIWVIIVHPYLI
jgi:hypothetical protein